jgi:hypothetical protein
MIAWLKKLFSSEPEHFEVAPIEEAPAPAGKYKDLGVRYVDLPIGARGRMLRVGSKPKQGQYLTYGNGTYRFSGRDKTRIVEICYELRGTPYSKIVSIEG